MIDKIRESFRNRGTPSLIWAAFAALSTGEILESTEFGLLENIFAITTAALVSYIIADEYLLRTCGDCE